MTVPLAERVYFPKSVPLPGSAFLEIEAGQTLQTYQVSLTLTAQLHGLRWLMHHYRLPMYLFFTFLFWVFELLFMGVAWSFLFPSTTAPTEKEDVRALGVGGKTRLLTKSEEDDEEDLSDHPHRFPTYALKNEPAIKDEEDERPLSALPIGDAEADDEHDEDDDDGDGEQRVGAGTGTSYSEGRSGQIRRRASGHGD